jgi:hypothetical protein
MKRAVEVPLARILKRLPDHGTWHTPGYQGPRGLYAVRSVAGDGPPKFQVCRLEKSWSRTGDVHEINLTRDISEPWLTIEGARKFAERLAEGVERGEP